MEKLISIIEKIPPKLIWLAFLFVTSAVALLFAYAVYENRTVEFWPPKIIAKDAAGSKAEHDSTKFYNEFIAGFSVPILVYKKTGGSIAIVGANEAAAEFYKVSSSEQLLGKTPVELHVLIKPWLSNYKEWASEQMERIAKANAKNPKPVGRTVIPMKLIPAHQQFKGDWYLTSNPVTVNNEAIIVTMFSSSIENP